MPESDGVDEAIHGSLRTGLMAAGRIGEQLARLRENQMRHNEARSAQDSRELQSRLDTERLAARAELAVVNRDEWWQNASAEDVTGAWQTANAWRTIDPEIERSAARIEAEVAERWGLDARATGARPDQVREHLQRILDARAASEHELTQAKKAEAEAAQLLLEADAMRDSRDAGGVDDISADEAREDVLRGQAGALTEAATGHKDAASEYSSIADDEIREAKIAADKGQALPARQATVGAGKRSKRASRGGVEQAQEHSISR